MADAVAGKIFEGGVLKAAWPWMAVHKI